MKNCKSFEKQLSTYLHGELSERAFGKLEVHLDGCESCRAALEGQRATLELLGDVLQAAPAPEKLTAWRNVPVRVPAHRPTFADVWFSPQFKAVCFASVFAVAFFMLSGSFVIFSVLPKAEAEFSPPPAVMKPSMPLKKIPVPAKVKTRKPKPSLRRRIVSARAVTDESEIIMPEVEGIPGGLGNMGGDGLGSLGFDIADGDSFGDSGGSGGYGGDDRVGGIVTESALSYATPVSGIQPQAETATAEIGTKWSGELAAGRQLAGAKVPKIPLKKLKVRARDVSKPKATAKLTAVVKKNDLDQIAFPDLPSSGIGSGIGGSGMGYSSYDISGSNRDSDGVGRRIGYDDNFYAVFEAVSEEKKGEAVVVNGAVDLQGGSSFYAAESITRSNEKLTAKLTAPVDAIDLNGVSYLGMVYDDSRGGSGGFRQYRVLDTAGTESKEQQSEIIVVDGARFKESSVWRGTVAKNEEMAEGGTDDLFGESNESAGIDHGAFKSADLLVADGWMEGRKDQLLGDAIVTSKSGAEAAVLVVQTESLMEETDAEELQAIIDLAEYPNDAESVPDRLKNRKPAEFNPYVLSMENAFSTFSIDVDTAAYGLARQQLLAGGLPEPESVRTEEFINSFDYDYRPPSGKQTFAVHNEMAPSPFRSGMDLLKVGIKGYRIGRDNHRGAMLTLVIDTSGSMSTPERMGLVKKSLALLLDELDPNDEVAIVQFGGEARLVLDHTPVSQKDALLNAVAKMQPGGPTQFDLGLELGYAMATAGFKAGASNRIIIMSDGVANVGELDPEAMLDKVGEHRRKGIYLSVLGFGAGTYDDNLLERLANRGDGMYAYIDSIDEARRLLVDQLAATLHVIASDVKIQIEFNPERVLRYRQLGYENRQLTKEQFRDDTVDAGEVGSGQAVTALYDVELDPAGNPRDPIATVYVRYRRADTGAIEEISTRVMDPVRQKRFEDADVRFQLAACTAEFAERLRRSPYAEGTEMAEIYRKLQPVALEMDLDAQVQELLRLISIADRLGN